jgi:hypothetical protein
MMEEHFNTKGISSAITAVLLIMVILGAALLGFFFLTGLSSQLIKTGTNTGISTTVTPNVYASDAKIDILGRAANFTVVLAASTVQVGTIQLSAGRSLAQNMSFGLAPRDVRTITMVQQLNQTGPWTLKVVSNGVKVATYSFTVVQTRDEADEIVSQYETDRLYRNLTLIGFMLAVTAFIVALAALARKPRVIRIE